MNNLSVKKIFLFLFLFSLVTGSVNAQIFHKTKNPEKALFGKTHRNKRAKVRESGTVLKAKRRQEANDRRLKKDYYNSVKRSRKRTIDIQTPEVQERMKQNEKDYTLRDKEKKKKVKAGTKKAGEKYK